jgi:hypothetical protein
MQTGRFEWCPLEKAGNDQENAADGELAPLNCGHNNCFSRWDAFWQSLLSFLTRADVLP